MEAFDKLVSDIKNAKSEFSLADKWSDIQAGLVALGEWRDKAEARLTKLEYGVFVNAPSGVPPKSS